MTLEEAWTDSYFLKAAGKTYQELIDVLKAELQKKYGAALSDELDHINYYLNSKKLIPSINYLLWREPDSTTFRLKSRNEILEVFNLMFEKCNLNIYYDVDNDGVTNDHLLELVSTDERITSSFYYKDLCRSLKTRLPVSEMYKILCLLAKIADEQGSPNPYFNILFDRMNVAVLEKSGNYKRHNQDFKYGKVIIIKTAKEDKVESLKQLLDLSFYDVENELEVLRYKNPEESLKEYDEQTFKKKSSFDRSLSKIPAHDIGAFAEHREKLYVTFINLHNLVGTQEFEKITYYAGVLSMLITFLDCPEKHKNTRKAFVSLAGCYDNRFNFFSYEVGATNVNKGLIEANQKMQYHVNVQDCPCCIYEDYKLKDAFLIAPGFEKYEEEYFQETFFVEETDPDYKLWTENFKDFATEDPFKAGRYRMSIPLRIHDNAALLKQERLFSRLVKAEKLFKQWICTSYNNSLFLSYIKLTISPDYPNLETFKKFLISHFNLFPCVRIFNKFERHKSLSSKDYDILTSKL